MNQNEAHRDDGSSGCGCAGLRTPCSGLGVDPDRIHSTKYALLRRELLQVAGLGSLALLAARLPVMAGPFEGSEFEKQIPADKKLHPEWVKSLFERGARTVYRGAELEKQNSPNSRVVDQALERFQGASRLWAERFRR